MSVDRPGVVVLYRHGYKAADQLVPYDRRAFMAHHRILAAASDARRIEDIRVALSDPVVTTMSTGRAVAVELRLDASQIDFRLEGESMVAKLNAAVFVGDSREALAGEAWEQIDLRLGTVDYDRLQRVGVVRTIRVSAGRDVRHIKAVVYDYFADRLGVVEHRIH